MGTPLPPCFRLNLCFVGVATWGWLQNIDFRDFGCKISGFNNLRVGRTMRLRVLGSLKAKGGEELAAFSDLYISILANRVKLFPVFSRSNIRFALWELWGFARVWGLDRILSGELETRMPQ